MSLVETAKSASTNLDPHPGIKCFGCSQLIGQRPRFKCLTCDSFDFCSDCEANNEVFSSHFFGSHFFAKIRDSSTINEKKWTDYRQKVSERSFMHDSYAFHKSKRHENVKNDSNALELTKKMLRLENKYRLSREYLTKYAESQEDNWKTIVTEEIQQRVVTEHLDEARDYFSDIPSGIDFLRGAVGNFPEHLSELMECANYVKYTQECKRGHLRVGDVIDGKIPLLNPKTCERSFLCDFFSQEKPLVIIASSST